MKKNMTNLASRADATRCMWVQFYFLGSELLINYKFAFSSQVVSNAVRQLQNLVTDEAAVECHELFLSESKSSATGGTCSTAYDRLIPELIYQKKAEKLLADENCMKIFIVSAVVMSFPSYTRAHF